MRRGSRLCLSMRWLGNATPQRKDAGQPGHFATSPYIDVRIQLVSIPCHCYGAHMVAAAPLDSDAVAAACIPDARVCEQARLSRDVRFDGLFFTAVTSTRIYCRPVCPAPTPKRENVTYFAHAAAAEAAGFRPCLRCRPELSPGDGTWRRGDAVLARALALIDAGLLDNAPASALAERVALSERQLRRMFVERLGATPHGVHGTRRLLFAKQLLTDTAMPVTQVALASGFNSLRRFNDAFAQAYRMAPRDLRRRRVAVGDDGLRLRLGYRPPYDFGALLEFLRLRALPGVDEVGAAHYARAIVLRDGGVGALRVTHAVDDTALMLELRNVPPAQLLQVVQRVRRMFDLDAGPKTITDLFARDPLLASCVKRRPGLRVPGGWGGFEVAVRAVLGQQVSVAAARTLATRLVQRFGVVFQTPVGEGLTHAFPTPEALAEADLTALGITSARADTIRGIARAMLQGRIDLRIDQTLDAFVERWTALPGIGAWTAHYIAMRALSHPDAFPADDLILRRVAGAPGVPLTARALTQRAQEWRPWRAYAVTHMWRVSSEVST